MKISILNSHSVLNSGDAAIVVAQIQFLKKISPEVKIKLSSRTPEIDKKFYGPLGVEVMPPLFQLPSLLSGREHRLRRMFKDLFSLSSKKSLLMGIKNSDFIISSGGGYLYSNHNIFPGPMFLQNLCQIIISLLLKKPVILFPQSFGPFQNHLAVWMLKNVLEKKRVLKVFAREENSFNFLKSLLKTENGEKKVEICQDMAFCLESFTKTNKFPLNFDLPQPIVALTLRSWDFPSIKNKRRKAKRLNEYLSSLRKACEKIHQRWKGSVVIFSQSRGPGIFENDRKISSEFWKGLKEIIPEKNRQFIDLPDVLHPSFLVELISKTDLILATRFHSAIFALISGVPAITISYQPKGKETMKILGLGDFCLDIDEVNPEKISELIDKIIDHHSEIKNKILLKIKELRSDIEKKLENAIAPLLGK